MTEKNTDKPDTDKPDAEPPPKSASKPARATKAASAKTAKSAPSESSDQSTKTPPPPRRSVTGVIALVGVLVIGGLAGAGGWFLYERVASLSAEQAGFADQSALATLRSEQSERLGELQGRLNGLSDNLDNRVESMARLENRFEDQVEARDALADRVDQLFRRMQSETDDWREAEAAYLAGIAVNRVRFNRDIPGALEALEAADRLLAGLGGAGIDGREAIARATDRLLDAERADTAAIMTGLSRTADRLADLPLAEGIERRQAREADDPAPRETTGWRGRLERAWTQLRTGLEGLVTVSRDRQVEPLPDPEARFLLQQNLTLQIESARLAALRGNADVYRDAVARIDGWIAAYFDSASKPVTDVRATLAELRGLRVDSARPAIADDLEPLLESGGQP
ncbi:MAG: uroporphyrinogen-III C-methyltransferase [Spiribacter sp.]|nr:uroporphyrinogen-III C-methyltransferase [Spiribacter sp.]